MSYELNSLEFYGKFEGRDEQEIANEKEFLRDSFSLILEEFKDNRQRKSIQLTFDAANNCKQTATLHSFVDGILTSFVHNKLSNKIDFQKLWYLLHGESEHRLRFLDEGSRFTIQKRGTDNQFVLYFVDTEFLNIDTLSEIRTYNDEFLSFIKVALQNKKNFIISGGTGCGKTTLLNILLDYPINQVYGVIEGKKNDLHFPNNTCIRTTDRDFHSPHIYKSFLGLHADYFIFDDIRQGISLSDFQPFVGNIHAPNPESALQRLQHLKMKTNHLDIHHMAIESKNIDFIIQLSRLKNGAFRITSVAEVLGMDSYGIAMNNDRVYKHQLDETFLINKNEEKKKTFYNNTFYTQDIFTYDFDRDTMIRTDWKHELF